MNLNLEREEGTVKCHGEEMLSPDGSYLKEASFQQPQAKETLAARALAEYLVVLG